MIYYTTCSFYFLGSCHIGSGFLYSLELLEPAAMLGGLVEQHPDVVSIVLNQASEPGNPAFNVALKCLKLLFQGVGK